MDCIEHRCHEQRRHLKYENSSISGSHGSKMNKVRLRATPERGQAGRPRFEVDKNASLIDARKETKYGRCMIFLSMRMKNTTYFLYDGHGGYECAGFCKTC